MRTLRNHLLIVLTTITSIIAFDQITKVLARVYLKPAEGVAAKTINVVGDFFILQYAENRGAFLSMGSKLPDGIWTMVMTLIPLIFLIVFFVYLLRKPSLPMTETLIYSGIIAGGLGNLYDRFRFGFVTDFLNFGIGDNFRTGILNIADIPITLGIIYLFIYYTIKDIQKKKALKESE